MIYRPEISACDHCGLCCRTPCLLANFEDVERLATHIGVSVDEVKRDAIRVEMTPSGQHLVRIKPRTDGGCPYHVENRCAVERAKPAGGRDFECWNAETFAKTYWWTQDQLRRLGFNEVGR
jgi:hypothetical protein